MRGMETGGEDPTPDEALVCGIRAGSGPHQGRIRAMLMAGSLLYKDQRFVLFVD